MTHKDIYTKFMIEYDKANVTSSYPSLTEYEVATLLDKAYYALIAQKVTGNNYRRVPFEADLKAITDIYPLVTRKDITFSEDEYVDNLRYTQLPSDFLYFVDAYLNCTFGKTKVETVTTVVNPTQLDNHVSDRPIPQDAVVVNVNDIVVEDLSKPVQNTTNGQITNVYKSDIKIQAEEGSTLVVAVSHKITGGIDAGKFQIDRIDTVSADAFNVENYNKEIEDLGKLPQT